MTDRSKNIEEVLAAGTRIEEFVIERALQSGGFGVTYLAEDRSLGRRVAIKEYLPREWGGRRADGSVGPRSSSCAEDYEWGLKRFLEEARTLARLDHARIVRVHRVIEAWGTAYMVMEYVEGRNLEEALRAEGPWPEARVRSLLAALLPGLELVHGAGLVHRDIKPANVMLRADGTPVLIDFGAARYAAGAHSRSLTSVLTPGYAPHEQYHQTAGKQGPWTDVYALGAVAYRALSGRTPAEAPARVESAARKQADPLSPVAQASAGEVSAGFGAAVASALALWPEDRPRDVPAWRAQWDAGAAPTPVPERPVPPPPRVGGFLRPARAAGARPPARRPWLAAASAALVLAVAGLAWWVGGAGGPESAGTVARAPVGENAVEAALGEGGGSGGSEVSEGGGSGQADAAATVPGVGTGDGSDSPPEADETGSGPDGPTPETPEDPAPEDSMEAPAPMDSGPEDSVSDVAPEAVEEALDLDRAGWRRIQEGLAALGLDPGPPDGLVGGGTRRAVRAYQAGAGKPATGFLDEADVTTLKHAAAQAAEAERQRLAEAEAAAEAAEASRLAELRRPGRVFRDCDGCPEMVVIPSGEFRMGSPASEEGRDDSEGPQHRVTVRSFALGATEVTFDEWEACVRGGGCNGYRPSDQGWGRGARPVINVSWGDAQAYVSWLSAATGAEYRLPSESEWEYAARAGTTTPFHTGATISTDQANYDGHSTYGFGRRGTYRERTTSVGTFAPNAFGLYDVHGNVLEWAEDCWHEDYAGARNDETAWTSGGDCSRRVLRGGSWVYNPRLLRSAARVRRSTEYRYLSAGFRVARTLD